MNKKTLSKMEKVAFRLFSKVHPHETYDVFQKRFLKLAKEITGLKANKIKELLKRTNRGR